MRSVHRAESSRHDGWVLPSDDWWEYQTWRRSGPPSDRVFSWIGRRAGEPVAAVVYTYGKSERTLYDLKVQLLSGIDVAAVRSSLAFLAANGSTAERLDTTTPGPILDTALDRPELAISVSDWPWMLRLVDLGGAIAARGFPSAISLTLDLAVADPVIAANQGSWRLLIDGGEGSVEPGGDGTVAVDIGDLARVYAGVDPRLLHDDGGFARITQDDLDALAAAFATRATLPIFF